MVFLDQLTSSLILSDLITLFVNSKTLISDILSNMALLSIISGNLTTTLSNHLPQFLLHLNVTLDSSTPRASKCKAIAQDLMKKILLLVFN